MGIVAREHGAVAEQAGHSKSLKCSTLKSKYHLVTVTIETADMFGSFAVSFLYEMNRNLILVTLYF